ncbi:MAG: hypothetical protein HUU01_18600 [Saprospiraceae bacterium]|nr:hypothetical protein [Saprospiraceae bacterium]
MIHNMSDVQSFPGKGLSAVNEVLGDLMNLVPLPGKVTIIPVKDFNATIPSPNGPVYVTMFNPENLSIQSQIRVAQVNPTGSPAPQVNADRHEGDRLSFDILIDGTGASGEKREVTAEIVLFNLVTGYNGREHESNNLVLIYGDLIFPCKLISATVKYSLFRPNGIPIRATISCTFLKQTGRFLSFLEAKLMSSDLTHRRVVKSSDRMDNLCNSIYESPRFIIEVARANNLTSFRKLAAGTELYFPPIEK